MEVVDKSNLYAGYEVDLEHVVEITTVNLESKVEQSKRVYLTDYFVKMKELQRHTVNGVLHEVVKLHEQKVVVYVVLLVDVHLVAIMVIKDVHNFLAV